MKSNNKMEYILQWIEHCNIEKIVEKIDRRKVLIWGAYANSKYLKKLLEDININIYGFIDTNIDIENYIDLPIFKPNILENDEKFFVFIPLLNERKEIIHLLNSYSYNNRYDYIYIYKELPNIVIKTVSNRFEDIYGNIIECKSDQFNGEIRIFGYNNILTIGTGYKDNPNIVIELNNNSQINIGDNFNSFGSIRIESLSNGNISIGDDIMLLKDSIIHSNCGEIHIEGHSSFGERTWFVSGKESILKIQKDCMFSNDVSVIASDTHSIIDLKHNLVTNTGGQVDIGKHVWIGKSVQIIHNTKISAGSIVGAGSVVKGIYESKNSVIAGNIAKIIKTDRTWDRRELDSFDEFIMY